MKKYIVQFLVFSIFPLLFIACKDKSEDVAPSVAEQIAAKWDIEKIVVPATDTTDELEIVISVYKPQLVQYFQITGDLLSIFDRFDFKSDNSFIVRYYSGDTSISYDTTTWAMSVDNKSVIIGGDKSTIETLTPTNLILEFEPDSGLGKIYMKKAN